MRKLVFICIYLSLTIPCAADVIFVDNDANGLNDGSSWTDAYNYLQDALNTAQYDDNIWVAEGMYTPDAKSIMPEGNGDRQATFQLINGVGLYGGFPQSGGTWQDRDPNRYETILSGDLLDNDDPNTKPLDLPNDPTRTENSYNVTSGKGTDSTAIIDGFTIIAGNANGSSHYYFNGGGMNNYEGNPTVFNCKFYSNSANHGGGGMSNGGGGMSNVYNSCYVVNCQFSGNSADRGGGMYNSRVDSLTILSCAFSGNSAANGGGMYNFYCDPNIINCTFSVNSSWTDGDYRAGGMVNWRRSSPTITNCIFWENSTFDGQTDESAQLNDGVPIINNCCIQGWTGSLGGAGNFGDDPLFVETLGADNVPGTEDDNPRLLAGSPCLNTGDNSSVPPSLLTDLDGNARIINGTVDMGAYEGPKQGFLLNFQSISVPESQTAIFTVAIAADPLQMVQVTVAYHSGDPNIVVQSGALLTFNSSNYSDPQTVTLRAIEDADYLHGRALIWVSANAFITAALDATEVDNDVPAILYVDADALGTGDGTSWENSFTNLQDAISIATEYSEVQEIRVAQGIYKPDQGEEIILGDRVAAFQLTDGLALKGGYAGFGQPDPNARDNELYETTLSGDLNGDDVEFSNPIIFWSVPNRYDNSEYVVTSSDCTETAVLDGFTITSGYSSHLGAGMRNTDSSPTVSNCTFNGNCAEWGAGMGNWNSSPKVTGCKFDSNTAGGGGAIDNVENSSPILINCTFSNNFGSWMGGGMVNGYAGIGGSANPILINCTFSGNSADGYGGGVYNAGSIPIVTNCTFTGNSAGIEGGGMYNGGSTPIVTNCTFTGNSAGIEGGGVVNLGGTLIMTNCILWGNTATNGSEIALEFSSTIYVDYCDVQGGLAGIYDDLSGNTVNWGSGNIDSDPLFVNTTSSDPNLWDYHLKSQGWRWDNDANNWTWDDVTSPCIDAGNPGSLLADEPMTLDVDPLNRWGENIRINMGAFGGSAEASMPPYDWALLADLTNDGIVNLKDFANQAQDWQQGQQDFVQPGDLNRNGTVDLNDALLMINDWLKTTSWY